MHKSLLLLNVYELMNWHYSNHMLSVLAH